MKNKNLFLFFIFILIFQIFLTKSERPIDIELDEFETEEVSNNTAIDFPNTNITFLIDEDNINNIDDLVVEDNINDEDNNTHDNPNEEKKEKNNTNKPQKENLNYNDNKTKNFEKNNNKQKINKPENNNYKKNKNKFKNNNFSNSIEINNDYEINDNFDSVFDNNFEDNYSEENYNNESLNDKENRKLNFENLIIIVCAISGFNLLIYGFIKVNKKNNNNNIITKNSTFNKNKHIIINECYPEANIKFNNYPKVAFTAKDYYQKIISSEEYPEKHPKENLEEYLEKHSEEYIEKYIEEHFKEQSEILDSNSEKKKRTIGEKLD